MIYVLIALAIALVGVVPFLLVKRLGYAATFLIPYALIALLFTGFDATFTGPFYGLAGFFAAGELFISAVVIVVRGLNAKKSDSFLSRLAIAIGIFLIPSMIFIAVTTSTVFMSGEYHALIGNVAAREWSKDIQPKDPKHIRLADLQNAVYRATKAIGQDGSIGSQFQVNQDEFTPQVINGSLWEVAPLEFRSFSTWTANGASPGYVKVSMENPDLPAELVKFPAGSGMTYSPNAYFAHELQRHLAMNGYIRKNFEQIRFEVDDNGHAWWIVSVGHPTIGWSGEVVDGVVIVDPATGANTYYPIGRVPKWVDNVFPAGLVHTYIDWWGQLKNGWLNTQWGKKDIVQGGDQTLIYDNAGDPAWVTDVTSANGADNSIVAVMYTDSRTGKSVYYAVPGGASNQAVLEAVDNNPQINYRHLHGNIPQLYNLDGTLASLVPLFNATEAFQGVAIVPIDNPQQVSTGATTYDALIQYQKFLADNGDKAGISQQALLKSIDGIVDRINSDTTTTGSIYYLHLAGVPYLFTGSSGTSAKLPVTEKGDRVHLTYIDTSLSVVPLHDFDNLSLPLGTAAKPAGCVTSSCITSVSSQQK